jgi:chorismate mutase / prephenate dehydratase
VARGTGSVGVLPLPEAGEPDPWWPQLLSTTDDPPRVIARLPFGARGNSRADTDALVIGCSGQDESGLDRTLLGAKFSTAISLPRISEALATAGLVCTFLACEGGGRGVHLIEVEGFVPVSDRRLDAFRSELGAAFERLLPLGGYAAPLSPPALATKGRAPGA